MHSMDDVDEPRFAALGVGGAGSLIAGVGCLLVPIPFLFYRYHSLQTTI